MDNLNSRQEIERKRERKKGIQLQRKKNKRSRKHEAQLDDILKIEMMNLSNHISDNEVEHFLASNEHFQVEV